jgi:nitrite reductase/ring-hydroxylating ferredoxin subunit
MARGERVICAAHELAERGLGVRFELGDATTGFVVRVDGEVHAYVNRCPHAGTELDWQPGDFFEVAGLYLTCSTHGALFEPRTGFCVAGPCRGASLERLQVRETEGRVVLGPQPSIDDEKNPL